MSVIIFILILAVLIVVHECGHFIVAKKWGVRVDEFGIGYPPRAKVLFKRAGTLFTLNWIPFGGFVKIFGEDPNDESLNGENKSVALTSKSRFAQATVMFAGPLFNFIFAWLIILVILFLGLPSAIDSKNEKYTTEVKTVITEVVDDSPASVSGVLVGDAVQNIEFEGVQYSSLQEVDFSKSTAKDKILNVTFLRDGETLEKEISIGEFMVGDRPGIGVGLQTVGIYKPPFFKAVLESFRVTGQMIYQITFGLGSLIVDAFRGQADVSNLTGPVGIVSLVGDASNLGVVYLLMFVALISVNLGVINLIPFPALDGGRILFLVIEKIKGGPISPKVSNTLNSVGFLVLIGLMLFITFRDIVKLF
ncbi:MAG: regulator of sigma protease [Patescibacteria group bacterium]|nr:regulator of sigma protease [Patescibacteria group bacterium]